MTIPKFSDFLEKEDPLYELFTTLVDIVIDEEEEDEDTEYDDEYWENYEDPEEHLDRLSQEARLLYVSNCFNGEMINGGFNQVFFNSTGNHIAEIKICLKTLGATNCLELLEKAIKHFPNSEPPRDRGKRQEMLIELEKNEAFNAEIKELDSAYYEIDSEYYDLIMRYIVENKQASLSNREDA